MNDEERKKFFQDMISSIVSKMPGPRDPLGETARRNAKQGASLLTAEDDWRKTFAGADKERTARNANTTTMAGSSPAEVAAFFAPNNTPVRPNTMSNGDGTLTASLPPNPYGTGSVTTRVAPDLRAPSFLGGSVANLPAFPGAPAPSPTERANVVAATPNPFLADPKSLGKLEVAQQDLSQLMTSFARPTAGPGVVGPQSPTTFNQATPPSPAAPVRTPWPDINAARRRLGVSPFLNRGGYTGRTGGATPAENLARVQFVQRDPRMLAQPAAGSADFSWMRSMGAQ